MIKNERQYAITKTEAARFEEALERLLSAPTSGPAIHPLLSEAQEDALRSQLADLKAELAEYESLRSGKQRVITADSIEDLPRSLIKARIALGLTQKDLAERLNLKEQQIQRYEATEYSSASLARIGQVVRVLGIQVREEVRLPNQPRLRRDH